MKKRLFLLKMLSVVYKYGLLSIESVAADELAHQGCGRNFVVNVCLVDEVKYLYYRANLVIALVGGRDLGKEREDVLFQYGDLVEGGGVEHYVGILLEGIDPSLLAGSYRLPHIEGVSHRCTTCFVVSYYSAQKPQVA